MASTANNFLSSMLKFSVASWVTAGIALISVPIVTRFFTPEEFGKINMFTMVVGIIAALVGLSMEQSYVRFFKEAESEQERKKILTQCIAVVVFAFFCFIVADIFLGRWLSFYLFEEINPFLVYIALPIMVLSTIIVSYQSLYFRMSEKAMGFAVISILSVFANKVAIVGAAFYSPNYIMGIVFMTITMLAVVIIYCVFSPNSFSISVPKLNKMEVKPLLRYALPLVPCAFIALLNTFIIRFMLKDYVSYAALGVFTAAISIAGILSLVQSGFTIYWTPFLLANYKTEQALIKKIHSVISFVMVAFSLCLILFSDVIFLILGEEYRIGKEIFALLLVYPVTYTIYVTTCCGSQINKKTYQQLFTTIICTLVSVFAAYMLMPIYGLLGAAISNAIGGITLLLVGTFYGQREYKSVEKFYRTVIALVILLTVGFINYFISDAWCKNICISFFLLLLLLLYKDVLRSGGTYCKVFLKK